MIKKIYYCDRCGNPILHPMSVITIEIHQPIPTIGVPLMEEYQFCTDCKNDFFEEFLKEHNNG